MKAHSLPAQAAGTADPCLVSWELEAQQQTSSTDESVIKNVAATAYAGKYMPALPRTRPHLALPQPALTRYARTNS